MKAIPRSLIGSLFIIALIGVIGWVGGWILPGTPTLTDTPTASASSDDEFVKTWERTDRLVAEGQVSRTWMWGPESFSGVVQEDYDEAPGGKRSVMYYDKSRMEVTDPSADPDSAWFVTNGLLTKELITGRMQVGDNRFEDRLPAHINVAGDSGEPDSPTYATFAKLLNVSPHPDGAPIVERVDRSGNVVVDPELLTYGVNAAHRLQAAGIDHQVASPFWVFMNSGGTIYEDGELRTGQLFENPFFATGYPITEAYWADVKVGGIQKDVLIQCFERRCLTYTPGNAEGWKVEAGNVGQHYYTWRYNPAPDEGDVLYESSLLDWSTGDRPFGSIFVQDDAYRIRVTTPDTMIDQATKTHEYSDVSASLDLRMIAGSGDSAGCLVFRLNFDSFSYTLCINGRGETSATYSGYIYGGTLFSEQLLEAAVRQGASQPSEWNTIRIAGRGDQLWFFANDKYLGTATHAGSASGSIGMQVVNHHDSPAEFAFRNLSILEADQSLEIEK